MLATILFACGEPTTWATSGGVIVLVTMVALWRRTDPVPTPVPAGATVSPDGYYWWDGASWRSFR